MSGHSIMEVLCHVILLLEYRVM